jgi:hypothetical protein
MKNELPAQEIGLAVGAIERRRSIATIKENMEA